MINKLADNLQFLPEKTHSIVIEIVDALRKIQGVEVVILGGSHASGQAHEKSDIDLSIFYYNNNKPSIDSIRSLANGFDISKNAIVTDYYEWGPWVNGGAWLTTENGKVDVLYRNIEQIVCVIENAKQGKWEWCFEQQPPYGFYSIIYLAEIQIDIALFDPKAILQKLKQSTSIYPELLRKSLIQDNLWAAEFTLVQAAKYARQGDVYSTAGCITRICAYLTQIIFALNRQYFLTDKMILKKIENFEIKPENYLQKVSLGLSYIGLSSSELTKSVESFSQLVFELKQMAGDLYQSKYTLS